MSGKRVLKKQQKRAASAQAQLDELYRRGADDEFLARAAEQGGDVAASPPGARWAEVADRACRQSLGRADLPRLERLLPTLRRGGRLRPLAILAEAVVDLGAGRLEPARSRLAALAGAESGAAIPPDLVASLLLLAREDAPRAVREPAFELQAELRSDLRDLASWRELAQGSAAGSFRDPRLRAAGQVVRALQLLPARSFAPSETERKALARAFDSLQAMAADDGALRPLLDSAWRCLSLLADLAALDTRLDRPPDYGGTQATSAVVSWLRGPGPLLAATLAAAGPPLLTPLRHAVRTRWRAVLERVAAREGALGLAVLLVAEPKLFAYDVDLPGGPAQVRQSARAGHLLAAEDYQGLIELLEPASRTAAESGAVAALWSLEMWAFRRATGQEHEEDKDEEDEDRFQGFFEPIPHRAVVRLEEMAGEIGQRFPPGQRPEVARFLADELFMLSGAIDLCDHFSGAALALMEHQPGNRCAPALLIVGLAGAIAADAPPLRRALEAQTGRLPKVGPGDALDQVRRVIAKVAREEPSTVAQTLAFVQPLFTASCWPEVAAVVAREMGPTFLRLLDDASFAAGPSASPDLGPVRRELERLRPALAGTPGLAAIEVVADCWRPEGTGVEKRIGKLLASQPGLEGVLLAFELVESAVGPFSPDGIDIAIGYLADAVIDRLDDAWQRWFRRVPMLALAAVAANVVRLELRIRGLLARPGIDGEERRALDSALRAIKKVEKLKRSPGRAPRRRRRRQGARRDRSAPPQLRFDFE